MDAGSAGSLLQTEHLSCLGLAVNKEDGAWEGAAQSTAAKEQRDFPSFDFHPTGTNSALQTTLNRGEDSNMCCRRRKKKYGI